MTGAGRYTQKELFGAVHKRRSQSEGVFQCGLLADKGGEGSSDADVRTFWCKKHQIFRNLWYVCMDKGEEG